MPSREELVRANVLNEIADDYEEIGQILIQLDRWSASLQITRDEVKTALSELIYAGWANAYKLSPSEPHVTTMPAPEPTQFEELYFYITSAGKAELRGYPDDWFTARL